MKKNILLLAATCLLATALQAQTALPQNITLKTLDGQTVQSSAIHNDGRPLILSFWATWCHPCNRELSNIKETYEEWQEETGVKLVAVSIDDSRTAAKVKPHVDAKDWPYEIYLDQNSDLKRALGVVNVPHTFILDGEGHIVWQHTGYQDGSEEEVIEQVRALLKQ